MSSLSSVSIITKKRRRPAPQKSSKEHSKQKKESSKKSSSSKSDGKKSPTVIQTLGKGNCISVSERFRKVGRIGQGTYGVVYKAEDRQTPGDFVALKRCIPHHTDSEGFPITTIREIQALRILQDHPNVISLRIDIGMVAISKHDIPYLVLEYADHDLAQLMDHHYTKTHQHAKRQRKSQFHSLGGNQHKIEGPFREAHIKTLMQQLFSAIECLHEHRLIHRDIKVSNLLYTHRGQLKLADFGLSRSLLAETELDPKWGGYHMTQHVVSLWYRPPELLLGSECYNQSIDLWGAGCVMAELLQGFPLFGNCKSEGETIEAIFASLGTPTVESLPNLMDMPLIKLGLISLSGPSPSFAWNERKSKKSSHNNMMLLLDSFSYLSTSGLLLLTHLLHYDANNSRLTAKQALESAYFTSQPLPTPPSEMPKFASLHSE